MVLPEPVSPTTATTDSAGMVKEHRGAPAGLCGTKTDSVEFNLEWACRRRRPLRGSTTSTGTSSTEGPSTSQRGGLGLIEHLTQLGDRLEQQVDENKKATTSPLPGRDRRGTEPIPTATANEIDDDIDDGEHAGEPDLAALLLGEPTLDRAVETLTNRFAVAVRPDDLGTRDRLRDMTEGFGHPAADLAVGDELGTLNPPQEWHERDMDDQHEQGEQPRVPEHRRSCRR